VERHHDGSSFQARRLNQTLRCVATLAGSRHGQDYEAYNQLHLELVARLKLFKSMYDAICLEMLTQSLRHMAC